jgi:DNA-directed RNA polymerase subunit RPC12/RpoP
LIFTVNLQIPVRIVCVQCNMEIVNQTGGPIAQCPKCGFKVRIESGPQQLPGLPAIDPKGKGFRRPPPAA